VGAVHQDLGLDDRDDAVVLAERRVTGERMGVGLDRAPGGDAVGDVDHRPPLGEARAALVVLDQPFAEAVHP
jgi:hypothetical protein